jgi:hypothetical protein
MSQSLFVCGRARYVRLSYGYVALVFAGSLCRRLAFNHVTLEKVTKRTTLEASVAPNVAYAYLFAGEIFSRKAIQPNIVANIAIIIPSECTGVSEMNFDEIAVIGIQMAMIANVITFSIFAFMSCPFVFQAFA